MARYTVKLPYQVATEHMRMIAELAAKQKKSRAQVLRECIEQKYKEESNA